MGLDNRIKTLAESLGADYYGVADLTDAHDVILMQGGSRVAEYPSAMVMGIGLLDTLVDLLPDRVDTAGAVLYRHYTYDVVNQALDQMALWVANTLQQEEFRAFPVPASKRTNDEHIAGIFSQKLAANRAGLGWIGKSCLLVTPERGPRVRWVSILTDAPLAPSGLPMEPRCGRCTACVDICPVHAFTGRPFSPDEPREARFNAAACDQYFRELEGSGRPAVCGLCLYVCPYGRTKKGDHQRSVH